MVNRIRLLGLGAVAATSVIDPQFTLTAGVIGAVLLGLPVAALYRTHPADWWAVIFATLLCLSLTWSVVPTLSTSVARDQVAVAILFVALRIGIRNRKELATVGLGYLAGCLASVWLLLHENPLARASLTFDAGPRYAVAGLNPNYTAYALAGGAAVIALASCVYPRWNLAWLMAALVLFVGINLTGARGALIAFGLALALWLLPRRLGRVGLVAVYGTTVVLGVGILTGWTDSLLRSYVHASFGRETGDLNGRLSVWPLARSALDDRFWFGHGAGAFPALNLRGIFAHDVLLDVGTSVGVVGIAVYLVLMWSSLISGTRGVPSRLRSALLGSLFCALVPPLLTGYWYQAPAAWVVIALYSQIPLLADGTHIDSSEVGGEVDRVGSSAVLERPPGPAGGPRSHQPRGLALVSIRSLSLATRPTGGVRPRC